MTYRYDVFVSVKWDDLFGEWVRDHFIPVFETHVKNDIIAKCGRAFEGAFYYRDQIQYGQHWKNELKKSIPYSRCIVALCSPEYFLSPYCMLEWKSFSNRAITEHADLIVPVSIHDGQSFPKFARDIQIGDLQDYVIPGEGFKKTAAYSEFVQRVRALANSVAERVRDAPPFKEWPVADADLLVPAPEPDIPQETL